MSILDIQPLPGSGSTPVVGTPIRLADLPAGVHLRSPDSSPVGVIYVGAGDTTPPVRVQVVDASGNPIDLTGCSAQLHMVLRRSYQGAHTVSGDADVIAALAGFVEYSWAAGDTVAGSYLARIVLSDTTGAQMTLPASGGIPVEIS